MKKVPLSILALRIYFNSIGKLFPSKTASYLIKLFSTPRSRVIREKEIEVLKKAKKERLKFEGEELAIYEWGQGSKYALLCHGWESNAGCLGAFVPLLIEKGYKVIAFDGPAHGSSEGKQATLISFTNVAKQVVKKYGLPEIAMGHSLGANVIMLLCYEEKITIDKCVLISPVNRIRSVFDGFKAIFKIPENIYQIMIEKISKRANYRLDDLLFEKIVSKTAYNQVLLMHDVEDKITAVSHSEAIAKNWKKAAYKPIQGSGHYKILWHDQTIEYVKEFLKS